MDAGKVDYRYVIGRATQIGNWSLVSVIRMKYTIRLIQEQGEEGWKKEGHQKGDNEGIPWQSND